MLPVSRNRPCQACGRHDWCLIAQDGRRGICQRVGSPHPAGDAGHLHIYEDTPPDPVERHRRPPVSPPLPSPVDADGWRLNDLRMLAEGYSAQLTADRATALATALGLPPACIDALPLVGWRDSDRAGPCWTFAEWDAAGRVVGLMRRFREGSKWLLPGGRRGVYLPHDWQTPGEYLLLVEGASDVLAAAAAGITAIGRPSAAGGGDILAALLTRHPPACPVYILAENDAKPDGRWPGKEGAERLHDRLAAAGIKTSVSHPPRLHKDARDWLRTLIGPGVAGG